MAKSQISEFKKFGFFDPINDSGNVQMNYQQMVAGFPVGIVYIDDTNYPMVPGNVNNASTYDFPVILRTIPNMSQERVFAGDPTIADDIIEMGKYLIQKEGIRALSSGCGFFGNFQEKVAAALDIPVALSPLVMIPWIQTMIKPNQKIGVLTANAGALTPALFKSCGVENTDRLIIRDLYHEPEFSCILTYRGYFNNNGVRDEVVGKAMEIMNEDDEIGAFLLECSDLPPYSYAIQAATQRPVFDFISMIKFMKMSVTQKPYTGWL